MSDSHSLEDVRIGILGSDARVLEEHAGRLREAGAVVWPRVALSDLAELAEHCAVVVVIADLFENDRLLPHLEGIERWELGPMLLVVTDREPPLWHPTVTRVRFALVASTRDWLVRLSDIFARPTEPELPFTD